MTKKIILQSAAVPFRDGHICLVNSMSDAQKWGVPKGCIDPGWNSEETALNEAWEEAGLKGTLLPEPIGSYDYEKWGAICRVIVYVMEVTEESDHWMEDYQRNRRWLPSDEAVALIRNTQLRGIVQEYIEQL